MSSFPHHMQFEKNYKGLCKYSLYRLLWESYLKNNFLILLDHYFYIVNQNVLKKHTIVLKHYTHFLMELRNILLVKIFNL